MVVVVAVHKGRTEAAEVLAVALYILMHVLSDRYLHLELDQFSDPSSIHRLARVKELPVPSTPEQVLDVLGDTQDKDYPIFRTDTASDHVDTLCTGGWCRVCVESAGV